MSAELPIMPLNTVLFPGMPMPLVIFEERYLELIQLCQEQEQAFGVALIKAGQEVGGPAVPYDVGTTASISSVVPTGENMLQVVVVGQERFRLTGLVQQEPYLVGEVEALADEPDTAAPAELAAELRELFGEHLRLVLLLLEQQLVDLNVPEGAGRLSYMVAAHLTSPLAVRQRLLETNSLAERLFYEKQLLRRESADYRLILSARQKYDELVKVKPDDDVFSLN